MSNVHVLACPDKFRGTLSAPQVAAAIAAAVEAFGGTCVQRPLADGGEGTLDALGGGNRSADVTGPLGSAVTARWRLSEDGSAIIEAAQACGLVLAGGADGNDPLAATTRGVGELLVAAVRAGASSVLVGVGGSASTDGGVGAVDALSEAGCTLDGVDVMVCCDVRTPFTRAGEVFGPQKGATPQQVAELTDRLRRLRTRIEGETGIDLDAVPGSGAAGGLAGGLAARGARLVGGFDAIADEVHLDRDLAGADLVVTGEGRVDATSLDGKVVGGVLARAKAAGKAAVVVCGTADVDPGVPFVELASRFGPDRSWSDTATCIGEAVAELLSRRGTMDA